MVSLDLRHFTLVGFVYLVFFSFHMAYFMVLDGCFEGHHCGVSVLGSPIRRAQHKSA